MYLGNFDIHCKYVCLLFACFAAAASGATKQPETDDSSTDSSKEIHQGNVIGFELSANKAMYMFLAALGVKFLALLPIILTKLTVLGFLNFFTSGANLLLTAGYGIKSFLQRQKGGNGGLMTEEEFMWQHPEMWGNQQEQSMGQQPLSMGLQTIPSSMLQMPSEFRYRYVPDSDPKKLFDIKPASHKFSTILDSQSLLESRVDPQKFKSSQDQQAIYVQRSQIHHFDELPPNTPGELGKYKCYWISDTDFKRDQQLKQLKVDPQYINDNVKSNTPTVLKSA